MTYILQKAFLKHALENSHEKYFLSLIHIFPELGVQGAAIATVLSRYVEAAIIIIWSHTHTEKMPFAKGLYSTLKVPANLTKKILIKGCLLYTSLVHTARHTMGVSNARSQ